MTLDEDDDVSVDSGDLGDVVPAADTPEGKQARPGRGKTWLFLLTGLIPVTKRTVNGGVDLLVTKLSGSGNRSKARLVKATKLSYEVAKVWIAEATMSSNLC